MAELDLVVRGGTVVGAGGRRKADVGVRDGVVVEVGAIGARAGADELDATSCFVLPGVVDPHVHFTILSTGDDEAQVEAIERDLETETLAAAFGGTTTVLVMLNLTGPYSKYLDRIAAAVRERAYVDVGVTAIVSSDEHVAELPALAQKGVSGFKHFFNAYRKPRPGELLTGDLGLLPVDEGTFLRSLEAIRALGAPALAMVHAEDADTIALLEGRERARGARSDLHALARARPSVCETLRMNYAAEAARHLGSRLHFVHCTSYEGLRASEAHIAEGADISLEAVTHCLTSTYDAWDRVGVWAKFSPPLRGEADRRALWAGIREDVIHHIASDHCSWTREEKEAGNGQFGSVWDCPPGISNGLEHLLAALVTYGIRPGELDWERLVATTSTNTAARFGYPGKGRIAPGADADLVVVDPSRAETVGPGYYHGRGRELSIYWGEELYGRPLATISRGRVVVRDGRLTGTAGVARFVPADYGA